MQNLIKICVTCPNDDLARDISKTLIEQHLVACAQRARIESMYEWEGRVECELEIALTLKSVRGCFNEVVRVIKSIHPYDTPQIYSVNIDQCDEKYAKWVLSQCNKKPS